MRVRAQAGPRFATASLVLLAVALPTGCLSRPAPQVTRYALIVEPPESPNSKGRDVLQIGRFTVAPAFERKNFVIRTGESTFDSDFYNEWFAAPDAMLREGLFHWLDSSGVFRYVTVGGRSGQIGWVLEGHVTKLYGDDREQPGRAVVEIVFKVIDVRGREPDVALRKAYGQEVPVETRSPEALVEAWRIGMRRIFEELESDLREVVDRRVAATAAEPRH